MRVDLIIGTDQNIDLLKSDTHKQTGDFLNEMLENLLLPMKTIRTRVTHQSATLIDNIYTTINTPNILLSTVVNSDISDHWPCWMVLDVTPEATSSHEKITYRDFSDQAM